MEGKAYVNLVLQFLHVCAVNPCALMATLLKLSIRTRRRWNPNVINKRVWSDSLNDWVRFKVSAGLGCLLPIGMAQRSTCMGLLVFQQMTTHVLREIDKVGGIDEYLARLPEGSIEDPKIMDTRNRVLLAMREQQDSLQQS